MGRDSQPRWTIAELGERVAAALAAADYRGPANGQVRAVPDLRTIRYYTTLGLLDRPVEMRGRTALYGPRHLQQLIAIKRLQARGVSLAEIQETLAGLSPRRLAALAAVPPAVWADDAAPGEGQPARPAAARRAERFWRAIPAGEPTPAAQAPAAPAGQGAAAPAGQGAAAPAPLAGVPLAPGVTLLVETARAIGPADAAALRAAAGALLETLERIGIGRAASAAPARATDNGSETRNS